MNTDASGLRNGNYNLEQYLSQGTENEINAAKDAFITPFSTASNCIDLPALSGTNSIEITGRNIGSTYESPKMRVILRQNGVVTQNNIVSINSGADAYNLVNGLTASLSTINNSDNKEVVRPHLFTMNQDLLINHVNVNVCLLYTSPSPRDVEESRMPSSA